MGQFITNDGIDTGKLVEVKQFYTQDGKKIEHPSYTVNGNQHDSITDDYCADWVAETQDGTNFLDKGGLGQIEKAIDAGVVLVMSLCDDHYANMLWFDSTYPVDSSDPGAARGSCHIFWCSSRCGISAAQCSCHLLRHQVWTNWLHSPWPNSRSNPRSNSSASSPIAFPNTIG